MVQRMSETSADLSVAGCRRFAWGLVCSLWLSAVWAGSVEESTQPAMVVEGLHDALLRSMQAAQDWDFEQRSEYLSTALDARFALRRIARFAVGARHWEALEPEQQQSFYERFRELTIITYATRFDTWEDARFVTEAVESTRGGRVLVRTRLLREEEEPVRLDYLLDQSEAGEWRILGVIANGVNDLAVKRAEYSAVIRQQGMVGLLEKLAEKIASLRE